MEERRVPEGWGRDGPVKAALFLASYSVRRAGLKGTVRYRLSPRRARFAKSRTVSAWA
jgi:hypothetical protein